MTRLKLKLTPEEKAARNKAKGKKKARQSTANVSDPMTMAFEEATDLSASFGPPTTAPNHIPRRWRSQAHDQFNNIDPDLLDTEEYAEWVRMGMFRKDHPEEYEEQQRLDAEKAAQKLRRKALKAEARRLAEHEKRQARENERIHRQLARTRAQEEYALRWQVLLSPPGEEERTFSLGFADIPWPIYEAYTLPNPKDLSPENLTYESIISFLLPPEENQTAETTKKDKLRETFLRFHPDKFEGRFMSRVLSEDQTKVREGLGRVVRVLNELMREG